MPLKISIGIFHLNSFQHHIKCHPQDLKSVQENEACWVWFQGYYKMYKLIEDSMIEDNTA